jgi:hypothetical protein
LREALATGLDKADAITPGHGALDLGLGLDRVGTLTGSVGIEARIRAALSAYAEAWGRYELAARTWDAGAMAGLRYRW